MPDLTSLDGHSHCAWVQVLCWQSNYPRSLLVSQRTSASSRILWWLRRITDTGRMQEAASSSQASGERADDGNQHPCNIESHLSKEGKARNLSSLSKFIFSFSEIPGMVSLHGGLPNASIFPFKSMKVELKDGTWLDMSEKEKVHASRPGMQMPKQDLNSPRPQATPHHNASAGTSSCTACSSPSSQFVLCVHADGCSTAVQHQWAGLPTPTGVGQAAHAAAANTTSWAGSSHYQWKQPCN